MITAVDANVLLDIFGADPVFGRRSAEALRSCLGEGRLVSCGVVWTEVASVFPSPAQAREALERVGVEFEPHASLEWMPATMMRGPRRVILPVIPR